MSTEGKTSYLAAKLARIYNAVKGVQKTGYNNYDKYSYVTEADLAAPLRAALAAENVAIVTSVEEATITEVKTGAGKDAFRAIVKVKVTLIDGDTNERIETTYFGVGDDRGDKGVYKAITGATKYALYKLFLVPTGDDPEAFDDEGKATTPKGATVEQTTEINDLFRTLACDDAKRIATFAWASESRAKSIDGITYEEATKIIASLKKKVKELNK
jgi:hypothetical protein